MVQKTEVCFNLPKGVPPRRIKNHSVDAVAF